MNTKRCLLVINFFCACVTTVFQWQWCVSVSMYVYFDAESSVILIAKFKKYTHKKLIGRNQKHLFTWNRAQAHTPMLFCAQTDIHFAHMHGAKARKYTHLYCIY